MLGVVVMNVEDALLNTTGLNSVTMLGVVEVLLVLILILLMPSLGMMKQLPCEIISCPSIRANSVLPEKVLLASSSSVPIMTVLLLPLHFLLPFR
jgi:hypothetical protein